MANAQEWLEEKYLEGNKHWERELYLNEPNLVGELDLEDFKELKRIYISHFVDESKLNIKNLGYIITGWRDGQWVEIGRGTAKITKLIYTPNAQEYLNLNFPLEERKDIQELDLTNLDLEGDLDLESFKNYLINVYLTGNPRLGVVKNKPEHTTIHLEAQEWLNWKYPNKEEVKVIELEKGLGGEKIYGELIITDFPKLEEIGVIYSELTKLQIINCPQLTGLYCWVNNLTELTITNCPNLQRIIASGNQLTNLDLSNNQQLEKLDVGSDIRGNNFTSNLDFLNHLVNLKYLNLSKNHFTGSLKPLRKLEKLEHLGISYTNISHGLEYLPESVKSFRCFFEGEDRVSDIWEELQGFEETEVEIDGHKYNDGGLKKWREVKWDKNFPLLTSPLLPPQLISKIKKGNKFRENYGIPITLLKLNVHFYKKFHASKN
jgi:hypothetical protein